MTERRGREDGECDQWSDRELVERYLACDTSAGDCLYARYKGFVQSVVRAFIRDDEDANDISDEAWLRAMYRPRLRGWVGQWGNLKGWLKAIAVSRVNDHFRHHLWGTSLVSLDQHSGEDGDGIPPIGHLSGQIDIEGEAVSNAAEAALMEAVWEAEQDMTQAEREAFFAKLYGQDMGELADMREKKLNAVHYDLHRARAKVQKKLRSLKYRELVPEKYRDMPPYGEGRDR